MRKLWLLLPLLWCLPAQAQEANQYCWVNGTVWVPCPAPLASVNGSVAITLGATCQTVLAAAGHKSLTIENNNTNGDNCWVFLGSGSATKATAILLLPGGSYTRYYPYVPSDAIQATCTTTADTLYVDTQ